MSQYTHRRMYYDCDPRFPFSTGSATQGVLQQRSTAAVHAGTLASESDLLASASARPRSVRHDIRHPAIVHRPTKEQSAG